MVVQTLTYGIRLHPSPAESDLLDRTCTAYLSCCDHVSRVAKSNRTLSQRKLNDLAYRHLRETYHVGSQMAQSAIIRVIGNYRTVKESLGDPSTTAMTSIAACPCPVVPVNGCNRSPTFN